MEKEYLIWKTNKFDNEILTECVGKFYSLELAKDFVSYQASLGEGFAITSNDKRVDV